MARTIRVLWVRAGEEPEAVTIEHDLAEMQRLVGGRIDCLALSDGVDLWLNDEGLLLGLPLNRLVPVDGHLLPVVGDFYLAGHDGRGNTTSLGDAELALWSRQLRL